jgi:hypothetical protein
VIERAAIDHRARRERGEADARFHVEHAGPIQLAGSRFSGIRSSWPIGHTVSKWPSRRICLEPCRSWRAVIAGGRGRHARHRPADRFEPRRQLGAAAIDRGPIVARRFDRDE